MVDQKYVSTKTLWLSMMQLVFGWWGIGLG